MAGGRLKVISRASATVRLVCAGGKVVYDALVRRLVLSGRTTDEAMGMLVLRFPAVVSIEFKGDAWGVLTDEGLRAVSNLRALTELDPLNCEVTDAGVRALSILPALTSLDLRGCWKVTAAGVQALRSTAAAPSPAHHPLKKKGADKSADGMSP